jgi:hypothetical protein
MAVVVFTMALTAAPNGLRATCDARLNQTVGQRRRLHLLEGGAQRRRRVIDQMGFDAQGAAARRRADAPHLAIVVINLPGAQEERPRARLRERALNVVLTRRARPPSPESNRDFVHRPGSRRCQAEAQHAERRRDKPQQS